MYICALCQQRGCRSGDLDKTPINCPCDKEHMEKIIALYDDEEDQKLAYFSALTESGGYAKKTRLEEIIDFANKCGYQKLGLAFCIGLSKEAKICSEILQSHGFEVESVICKVGSVPKEQLGIKEEEKLRPNTYEPMCNPIGQATLLNEAKTDFNIALGLCVGHDSLFFKYSNAPVTVFAVKDRVLAHNPLGAIYTADSYYKGKLRKKK